jgi:regulator of protease activity HflC (stomatin/prohibitin superfamily)
MVMKLLKLSISTRMIMNKPDPYDYRGRSADYQKAMKEYKDHESKKMRKSVVSIGSSVIGGIVALTILGGSWYTVDQGERGVILRYGAVIGTAEPGLGFKFPIMDRVVRISTQTRSRVYADIAAYSRDQQPAELRISVTYQLPEGRVEEIYSNFGGESGLVNRLIDRQVNESVRTVFGRYNAVEAIQQRERMAMDVREAVQRSVQGPVTIVGVQFEEVIFSDAYEASIEQRMLEEVAVQRMLQTAEREEVQARIRVIQATAEAEARVAQATAEAEAITLTGEAEASAIRARGAALRDNPALIELVQAERWNGILPTTMIPGQTVPFLNVGQ